MMEVRVRGVSNRKVAAVTEALCGRSFSSQLVSKLAGSWTRRWRRGEAAPRGGTYPYLLVDARYGKVRRGGKVISRGILIVLGIDQEGMRETLAVETAGTENETTWPDPFRDLKRRGLAGVGLAASGAHAGIRAAVTRYFQGASFKRRRFRFMRDLLPPAAKGRKADLAADLRAAVDSHDPGALSRRLQEITGKRMGLRPAVAAEISRR